MIIATSSEGTKRNGTGDSMKMELMSILRGEYFDPHTSIWYYRLDSVEEVGDPSCWIKANPNLGITVSYETYQRDVERAEKAPSARNDILAKDLVYLAKVIHISLRTKIHYHIINENTGISLVH